MSDFQQRLSDPTEAWMAVHPNAVAGWPAWVPRPAANASEAGSGEGGSGEAPPPPPTLDLDVWRDIGMSGYNPCGYVPQVPTTTGRANVNVRG